MSRAVPRYRRDNQNLPIPTYHVFEVAIVGSVEEQTTLNTFFYGRDPTPLNSTAESALWTAWSAAFLSRYKAALSADWNAVVARVTCLTDKSRIPYQFVLTGSGTGPSGHLPTQNAVLVSRYTGFRGQSGRGRIYLPAVPASWVANSQVLAGAGTTAYNHIVDDIKTALTDGAGVAYTAQLVSTGNKHGGGSLRAAAIVNSALEANVCTCRRRFIGRGK